MLDLLMRRIVAVSYVRWGVIVCVSNGMAAFWYYKENRHRYDLQGFRLSMTRFISKTTGRVAESNIPRFMRKPLFSLYGLLYDVNYDDIIDPLDEFENFQQFFTRRIKPREFPKEMNKLIVPADSRVLSFCEVQTDKTILVKDVKYSLGYFLTGQENIEMNQDYLNQAKKRENTKIYQIIFYLAPGDYHRYHLPTDFLLKSRSHIIGHLAPVKVSYITKNKKIYETNERVALFGSYAYGFMSLILVGAMNVGSMTLNYDKEFQTNQKAEELFQYKFYDPQISLYKGNELGMFKMGSTVVMLFEAESVKWNIEEGQKCKWGDVFAEVI